MHLWHRWKIAKEEGSHRYFECVACGKRKYQEIHHGYSPLDFEWLGVRRPVGSNPPPPKNSSRPPPPPPPPPGRLIREGRPILRRGPRILYRKSSINYTLSGIKVKKCKCCGHEMNKQRKRYRHPRYGTGQIAGVDLGNRETVLLYLDEPHAAPIMGSVWVDKEELTEIRIGFARPENCWKK